MIFSVITMIFSILIFLMLIWIVMILNNGFNFTNKNIDNQGVKVNVLVSECDKIVGKYKRMMQNIDDEK